MKKILLFALGVLFLGGCSKGLDNASVEGAFAKNSSAVIVIDYSDKEKMEEFKSLINKFPSFGLWQTLVLAYNKAVSGEDEELSYEKLLEPIINGQWKIGVSLVLPEGGSQKKVKGTMNLEDAAIYVAGEFSEADKAEEFINKLLIKAAGEELQYEEDDGIKYWTYSPESFFMMRSGDLFVATSSKIALDAAIKRMEEGGGFTENEEFLSYKKEFKGEAGYMFIDGRFFADFLGVFYEEANLVSENYQEIFKELGDMYVGFDFTDTSWFVGSMMKLNTSSEDVLARLGVAADNKLNLINKVNADGIIFYYEGAKFASFLETILGEFEYGLNTMVGRLGGEDYYLEPVGPENDGIRRVIPADEVSNLEPAWYENFVGQLASLAEVDAGDLENMFDSSYAVAVSDTGAYFPAVDLYVAIDEEYLEEAKVLSAAMSDYVESLILELTSIAEEEGVSVDEFVLKEVEVVAGGSLNKISVFFDRLPKETKDEMFAVENFDFSKANWSIYYGLTGDNNFVFAFHPDFEKVYGKNVLADDDDFNSALDQLGDLYGYQVSYLNPGNLVSIIERIVKVGQELGEVDEGTMLVYDLYSRKVFDFMKTIKYIVGSASFESGMLKSGAYVKVEELKKK